MTQPNPYRQDPRKREQLMLKKEVHKNREHISEMRREKFYSHSITIMSTISFVVGGTLIARTIWEYVFKLQGPVITILLGVIMLSFGGIIMHKFDEGPQ